MTDLRDTTVAFTGHRTYGGGSDALLRAVVGEYYARGYRTFLCGMAVGFDLAAAEAVLACRTQAPGAASGAMPGLRLVAVVPFEGQERSFSERDRMRFRRVLDAADGMILLSPVFHRGCYAVRNNYLVDHASALVAWYDGSPGGTHYTVCRARRRGVVVRNLCPVAPASVVPDPVLF